MTTPQLILNLVLFQLGWWLCVLSGAWGVPLVALAGTVVLLGAQFTFTSRDRRRDAVLLALVVLIGGFSDTAIAGAGLLGFSSPWPVAWVVSLTQMLLWANFALTVNGCMGFLLGRPVFAAIFGLLGGPIAYFGGVNFGALTLAEPLWLSLGVVGIVWALVLPLVFGLSSWIEKRLSRPAVAS